MSAVLAVSIESTYRKFAGNIMLVISIVSIPAVFLQICIYKMVTSADSLIGSAIAFSFSTQTLRTLITLLILKETPSVGAWIAFVLITLAQVIRFGIDKGFDSS